MTILDLINKSAIVLNIQEILKDTNLATITVENEATVLESNFALKRLYEFSKIVLNEISSCLPNVKEVECESSNKSISLNLLTRVSKVVGVKNQFGFVNFSIVKEAIKVDKDGTYAVIYNQYPEVDSLLSEIEIYNDMIGEDILVHGLNSYYCLATGLFAEFNVYNSHYTDRLNNLKNLKVFAMPCRSWE